jgi:hypothetical protein
LVFQRCQPQTRDMVEVCPSLDTLPPTTAQCYALLGTLLTVKYIEAKNLLDSCEGLGRKGTRHRQPWDTTYISN